MQTKTIHTGNARGIPERSASTQQYGAVEKTGAPNTSGGTPKTMQDIRTQARRAPTYEEKEGGSSPGEMLTPNQSKNIQRINTPRAEPSQARRRFRATGPPPRRYTQAYQGNTGAYDTGADDVQGASGVEYRISNATKWGMLTVAVLLDLLPVVLLFAFLMVGFSIAGGSNALSWCMQAGQDQGALYNVINKGNCFIYSLTSGTASILGALLMGPALYFITSLLSNLISFMIFFSWFTLKRVPYISLKGNRAKYLTAGFIIEFFPFLSWLPAITWLTWKQIRLSRKEDSAGA
jgi:hypothetical protein